jgi:glycosyltransferase involved in cell wall biosynthesis
MIHVTHIITSLGVGGAESVLCELVAHSDPIRFRHHVISLTGPGVVGERMKALGIGVDEMEPGISKWRMLLRLAGLLRNLETDVVKCWMYHANLAGSLAAPLAGNPAVIWGVHHCSMDPKHTRRATIQVSNFCAWYSRWLPAAIVYCAESCRQTHEAIGYVKSKGIVITNGCDTERFRPDREARARIRGELGIAPGTPVVTLPARVHPIKGHEVFLRAATSILRSMPATRFLLCGLGTGADNRALVEAIAEAGLSDAIHLLGLRSDIEAILPASDVVVSASHSEAFPNSIISALACGVPCVVTDVGDCADIVGDTGKTVPPGDPVKLAAAVLEILRAPAERYGEFSAAARLRVQRRFPYWNTSFEYHRLFEQFSLPTGAEAAPWARAAGR